MDKKGIGKLAVSGLVIGGLLLGGFAGATMFPKTVEVIKTVNVEVPKTVEVIKEVPTTVEVTKEVVKDDPRYGEFLQYVYDNDGKLETLVDGLDDDEVSEISDRFVMDTDFKTMAIQKVKDKFFDEADGEVVTLLSNATLKLDDNDMESLRVDDDFNEVEVLDVDFEDGDGTYKVTGKFRQDDEKFNFEAEVTFRDGEFDDLDITKIENYQ